MMPGIKNFIPWNFLSCLSKLLKILNEFISRTRCIWDKWVLCWDLLLIFISHCIWRNIPKRFINEIKDIDGPSVWDRHATFFKIFPCEHFQIIRIQYDSRDNGAGNLGLRPGLTIAHDYILKHLVGGKKRCQAVTSCNLQNYLHFLV